VLWNTHNFKYRDFGTTECNVLLRRGGKTIWEKKNLAVAWDANSNPKTTLDIPAQRFDVLRVEITKWKGACAGLAEIQLYRNERNIALGRPARASDLYDPTICTPEMAVDGLIDEKQDGKGYWLIRHPPGWIEIDFSR
jgi:hypothetical protein